MSKDLQLYVCAIASAANGRNEGAFARMNAEPRREAVRATIQSRFLGSEISVGPQSMVCFEEDGGAIVQAWIHITPAEVALIDQRAGS